MFEAMRLQKKLNAFDLTIELKHVDDVNNWHVLTIEDEVAKQFSFSVMKT